MCKYLAIALTIGLIILLLHITGCAGTQQLTVDQAEQIARDYGIKADIVWEYGAGKYLATLDERGTIRCNLTQVWEEGMSGRLDLILKHEDLHKYRGLGHCKKRSCLMHKNIATWGKKVLCGKCRGNTTLAWLFGGINGN